MTFLLVDNSNTRTKFALGSQDGVNACWHEVMPTAAITEDNLAKQLAGVHWDAVVLASVVPEKKAILASFFGERCHSVSAQSPLPLAIHYPKPTEIGADRLANAAGAMRRLEHAAIVLDFGTALTFDVIDGEPLAYSGGVIAPGLSSMTEGLARRTALLPHLALSKPSYYLGKSTHEAMLAGAFFGYRGLVKEILQGLRAEMVCAPKLYATGGDAALLTDGLQEVITLAPQLTLEGLLAIGLQAF